MLTAMVMAFLAGLILGFLGSVPIAGPIAVLVFERSAQGKGKDARRIAAGASVAESFYAFAAFFGLTTMLTRFPMILPVSRMMGALILIALGVYFVARKESVTKDAGKDDKTKASSILSGFTLTLLNPTLLATWAGAVTAIQSTGVVRTHPIDAFPFAIGVAVGIVLWFNVLTSLVMRLRGKITTRTMDRVVRGMGVVLVAIGLFVTVRLAHASLTHEGHAAGNVVRAMRSTA
jgi:threonine/homoserine/homoserine lactone efflux protein